MNLLLWRHADAAEGSPDLERPLTAKGTEQAAQVARWIRRELPPHPRIIVSPARRTRQTAEALKLTYTIAADLAPGASPGTVLALVERLVSELERDSAALLVGHQPWIGETAAALISGTPDAWSVRKAAVWWLVRRERAGSSQWTLRAVVDPDYV
jgi:phosphohistidine phosphatase